MISEILRSLWRSRLRRSRPSSKPDSSNLPLGLSKDQVEAIRELTGMVQWKPYSEALERLYELNVATMLRGLSHEGYLFQCGACYALEQIGSLPADLTNKARELDARHTAEPEPADPGAAIFANTPFWDAYQRLGKRAPRFDSTGVPIPGQRNGS